MNTALDNLQPYPFEKLRALLGGARPPATLQDPRALFQVVLDPAVVG